MILVSSQSEDVMEPREEGRKKRNDERRKEAAGNSSTGWLGNVWLVTRLMWDYWGQR